MLTFNFPENSRVLYRSSSGCSKVLNKVLQQAICS